jgi:hypothetical protein
MRILFVALSDNIHTARWLGQLANENWDLHLFPTSEARLHPDLRNVTVHTLVAQKVARLDPSVKQTGVHWPLRRGSSRAANFLEQLPLDLSRPARLARLIRTLKPDLVHVLEMQRAGYLTLDSYSRLNRDGDLPPLTYSCWGNDIFHFGGQAAHQERIRNFLAACDYYIADCKRDIKLARDFGFTGEVLGVFPVGGGFDIDQLAGLRSSGRSSGRRIIALKGYDGGAWGGRARVAVDALRLCADQLRGYSVVIYSANPDLQEYVNRTCSPAELSFSFLPESPHSEMMKLFGRSRLAIGVSISDGTPNSMLEAMMMGAFPIQSDTVSTPEWITNGENGLLVPPEDPQAIAVAIQRATSDDALVDKAAEANERLTSSLARSVIQSQVIAIYKRIAERSRLRTERTPIGQAQIQTWGQS